MGNVLHLVLFPCIAPQLGMCVKSDVDFKQKLLYEAFRHFQKSICRGNDAPPPGVCTACCAVISARMTHYGTAEITYRRLSHMESPRANYFQLFYKQPSAVPNTFFHKSSQSHGVTCRTVFLRQNLRWICWFFLQKRDIVMLS